MENTHRIAYMFYKRENRREEGGLGEGGLGNTGNPK